jgi:hypothetical protein
MSIACEPMLRRDFPRDSALTAKALAARATLARMWPPAVIGVGLVATIGWIGTLLWLSARMIIAFI